MKGAGVLVVSLRGVIFGFCPHLGCSGQNTIIFSRKGLFQGCTRRNVKKLYIFNSLYLLDSYNQSLIWSLRGQKRLAMPRLVSFRRLIQNFQLVSPLSCRSPPGQMCCRNLHILPPISHQVTTGISNPLIKYVCVSLRTSLYVEFNSDEFNSH